jgi:hypothetical protein
MNPRSLTGIPRKDDPATLVGALLVAGAAAALAIGCSDGDEASVDSESSATAVAAPATIPQPTRAQLAASGLAKLPVAPESERVDVAAPTFSNSTEVTNPLFPIAELHSAILNGRVEGKPFHTETTLLPETRIIEWAPGQTVETLVSQYSAFLDGRIEEVALDYYAQADDGSVWYFGEDVFNYNEDGVIADTDGTWLSGKEGPPAMIMPADPRVGDVHRPENIPGLVFEEVAVERVGRMVAGPQGPTGGALVGRELHDDGSYSEKVFAPGYGEFYSAHAGDVEALALAVPTDALAGPPSPGLLALERGAREAFAAIRSQGWRSAAATAVKLDAAWKGFRAGEVAPRLAPPMTRALAALAAAVDARDPARAGTAAIDVAQATVDLELRHLPPAEIDLARFELWARQIHVDADAGDVAGVAGDVATLEWIRDRFRQILEPVDLTRIDHHLLTLRETVVDEDLAAAAEEAAGLRETIAGVRALGKGAAQ